MKLYDPRRAVPVIVAVVALFLGAFITPVSGPPREPRVVFGAGIESYVLGSQVSFTKLTPNATYTVSYSLTPVVNVPYRVIVQSSMIDSGLCSTEPCPPHIGTTQARATSAGKIVTSLTGTQKLYFSTLTATKAP